MFSMHSACGGESTNDRYGPFPQEAYVGLQANCLVLTTWVHCLPGQKKFKAL